MQLLYKELVLAAHPTHLVFACMGALVLVPAYPFSVIFMFGCLGPYITLQYGRETGDARFTALLPVVGAYLGAFVGAFMISTVNPIQALGFLVFIVVLQQLEGNLIYPRVVGSSVGLPGIWVLAAVTVGGGLGGIIGMLLAVPVTATLYKLIQKDVLRRKAALQPETEVPGN